MTMDEYIGQFDTVRDSQKLINLKVAYTFKGVALRITQPGYLIEVENNKERISALEKLFTRENVAIRIRKAIITLLTSIDKQPIPPEYTVVYSIESIKKIINDKSAMFSLSRKRREEIAKKANAASSEEKKKSKQKKSKKAKKKLVKERDIALATSILRGLGLIEMFPRGNTWVAGLTILGDIVKGYVASSRISDSKKIEALILASLPFSTKTRVVYGLYYMYGPDYAGFYATLKDKLFTYDPYRKIRYYDGVERLGLEILHEVAMTMAGGSRMFVSETQLLVKTLTGYLVQKKYGEDKTKLNDVFVALNYYLRYPHSNKFTYEAGAWEALAASKPGELDEIVETYELKEIRSLFEKLKQNYTVIEHQLRGLYGLPAKY
jgi:hypothetical protein